MSKFIQLTEIVKDGDGTKTQPMLIQIDFIGTVTTGTLEQSGPFIIGKTKVKTLTFVKLKNNLGHFVEETLDQILDIVQALGRNNS